MCKMTKFGLTDQKNEKFDIVKMLKMFIFPKNIHNHLESTTRVSRFKGCFKASISKFDICTVELKKYTFSVS